MYKYKLNEQDDKVKKYGTRNSLLTAFRSSSPINSKPGTYKSPLLFIMNLLKEISFIVLFKTYQKNIIIN